MSNDKKMGQHHERHGVEYVREEKCGKGSVPGTCGVSCKCRKEEGEAFDEFEDCRVLKVHSI